MTKPRANEIDLLRFLAALAVVVFHYAFRGYVGHSSAMPYPALDSVARYGCYGVELFFMISGFVILMSAAGGSLQQFVVSRMVRLYPCFWVCCTLTFVVLVLFGKNQPSLVQYLSNMTMLSSFGFMQKIAAVTPIDGSYWSLVVEIRFYALVALVLLLRQIRHAELLLTAWLATVVLFELAGMEHLRDILIVDYAAYFIAGAMMYQIWSHGMSALRVGAVLGSWVLALYESWIALPKFEAATHASMDRGVVLALITSFFVIMFLMSIKKTGWIGRRNWIRLGALTYPLYLVHQAIGYTIFNHLYPAWNPHLLLWGTAAAMVALAYFINTRVEQPIAGALKAQLNQWWSASRDFVMLMARPSTDR